MKVFIPKYNIKGTARLVDNEIIIHLPKANRIINLLHMADEFKVTLTFFGHDVTITERRLRIVKS